MIALMTEIAFDDIDSWTLLGLAEAPVVVAIDDEDEEFEDDFDDDEDDDEFEDDFEDDDDESL
ncbi:MAG: hypothetical protein EA379_05110 [Phycisphaerales bacterium]|nr:MAG: hypothetical protein EA379_05110 [Phycisphaerales bacterium]